MVDGLSDDSAPTSLNSVDGWIWMKMAAAASGGSSWPGREKTAIWLKAGRDGT